MHTLDIEDSALTVNLLSFFIYVLLKSSSTSYRISAQRRIEIGF